MDIRGRDRAWYMSSRFKFRSGRGVSAVSQSVNAAAVSLRGRRRGRVPYLSPGDHEVRR